MLFAEKIGGSFDEDAVTPVYDVILLKGSRNPRGAL
jgi:hypothetical protein